MTMTGATQNRMTNGIMPVLELAQGRPVCTSLNVARHFGKEHKNVLRDIERLTVDLEEDFCRLNFEPTSVPVRMPKGGFRDEPAYRLSRDGFTLLAMGFTGKRALAWKVRYIQAFNAMEAEILRLRQERPAMPTGLEERLARLESAASGNAAAALRADFRTTARAALGLEIYESTMLMAGSLSLPERDREEFADHLLAVQLRNMLEPRRPRRRARVH